MTTKTNAALPDVANMTEAEYERRLEELFASTPRLPLDDPGSPLEYVGKDHSYVVVKGTNAKLDLILDRALIDGCSIDELDEIYGWLSRVQLAKVLEYYEANQASFDAYHAHMTAIGDLMDEWRRVHDPRDGLRERLWARLGNEQRARIEERRRKFENGELEL